MADNEIMATGYTDMSAVGTPPIAVPESAMPFSTEWSLADLQEHLGVPLERIRTYPPPGLATEADVVRALDAADKRLYELIDGVLVEKTVGQYESETVFWLIHFLSNYLEQHPIAKGYAPDAPHRVLPEQVRLPDAAIIRTERLPGGRSPQGKVLPFAPDLAVEVISESNTRKEMRRKLRDYFAGGTRLVWYIDPETRTAKIYTSETEEISVPIDGALDGGDVLPGFNLPLAKLFEKVGPRD
jgi:Uma2 family endonuclease